MQALGVARIAEDAAKSGPDIFDEFLWSLSCSKAIIIH